MEELRPQELLIIRKEMVFGNSLTQGEFTQHLQPIQMVK